MKKNPYTPGIARKALHCQKSAALPEKRWQRKKDSQSICCPFRRRYFLFLMGCNKKLYNVLGGVYNIYYIMSLIISVHKDIFFIPSFLYKSYDIIFQFVHLGHKSAIPKFLFIHFVTLIFQVGNNVSNSSLLIFSFSIKSAAHPCKTSICSLIIPLALLWHSSMILLISLSITDATPSL